MRVPPESLEFPSSKIGAGFLPVPITISAESDFRADGADPWVRVQRCFRGEIEEIDHTRSNPHIRLPDGRTMVVDAPRAFLRDEQVNRLYRLAVVRITAEYSVVTREYRQARQLEFVEHDSRLDEKELDRLTQRVPRPGAMCPMRVCGQTACAVGTRTGAPSGLIPVT